MNTADIARKMRMDILEMIHEAGSGHPGGSLSCADILAVLYFEIMNINKENVMDQTRDKFILSKGHASAALYAALYEKGIITHDDLLSFRKLGTRLQGHPNMNDCPGVDMSAGSLGQGLSVAVGMSIANKLDSNDFRTYCLCGDGECQEGMIWEAAMSAGYYQLDNLVLIVDHNGMQSDGFSSEIMDVSPIGEKFKSFGWNVFGADGHDTDVLTELFRYVRSLKGKPTVIIAETIKGKGVSFMENDPAWHGKAPDDQQYLAAINELRGEADE